MSNTVRRPRKRPRAESCAWTTFGWLLRRTAAFATVQYSLAPPLERAWRVYLAESSAAHVAAFFARRVAAYPHLRFTGVFRG
jgi:hypothetical protein